MRAVNVGPTSFIDAAGRLRAVEDVDVPSALVVTAALLGDPPTIYARFGDAPWIASAALITLVFWATKRKRAPDHAK